MFQKLTMLYFIYQKDRAYTIEYKVPLIAGIIKQIVFFVFRTPFFNIPKISKFHF